MRNKCHGGWVSRRGFTVVELLVATAVIGLLLAILLPAIGAARASAARIQCINNLKQISLAYHNYVETHQIGPSNSEMPIDLASQLGARSLEIPGRFLGYETTPVRPTPRVWLCPLESVDPDIGAFTYLANGGFGGFCWDGLPGGAVGQWERPVWRRYLLSPQEMTDGASTTVLMSEQVLLEGSRAVDTHFPSDGPQPLSARTGSHLRFAVNVNVDDLAIPGRTQVSLFSDRCTAGGESYSPYAAYLYRRYLVFYWAGGDAGFNVVNAPNTTTCHFGEYTHGGPSSAPSIRKGSYPATSFHPGGVNASFADGSARFVPETIDLSTWQSLCTSRANDLIGTF